MSLRVAMWNCNQQLFPSDIILWQCDRESVESSNLSITCAQTDNRDQWYVKTLQNVRIISHRYRDMHVMKKLFTL